MAPLLTARGGAESETGRGGRELKTLTLYSVFLHFLDLGDGLSQVVGELLAVLRVWRVEVDEDFDVGTRYRRCEPDSVWVIWGQTVRDQGRGDTDV